MGPVITVPIAIESAAAQPFLDIPVVLGPAVVLAPAFAVTSVEAASKVNGGSVSARSTLVIEGRDVVLDNLVLDGALVVKAVPGARVTLKNLTITNSGAPPARSGHADIRPLSEARATRPPSSRRLTHTGGRLGVRGPRAGRRRRRGARHSRCAAAQPSPTPTPARSLVRGQRASGAQPGRLPPGAPRGTCAQLHRAWYLRRLGVDLPSLYLLMCKLIAKRADL